MAATKVTYDPTTPLGKLMAEAVSAATALKAKVHRIKEITDAITDTGTTKTALEIADTNYGTWAKVANGQGAAFYDIAYGLELNMQNIADILLANGDYGDNV